MDKRLMAAAGGLALAAGAALVVSRRAPARAPDAQAPAAEADARLTRVEGPVFVHHAGGEEGRYVAGAAGLPLAAGDIVRTGPGGYAELAVDRDSLLELGPRSYLIVGGLDRRETSFYLRVGAVVAHLALAAGSSMAFETPTAVAAVRGTRLAVERRPDEPFTRVGVFRQGRVRVSAPRAPDAVELGPGQETSVGLGRPPEPPGALAALRRLEPRLEALDARRPAVAEAWSPVAAGERARRRAASAASPPADPEAEPAAARRAPAPEDPLRGLRDRMRGEVRGKMKRDRSLERLRDKMRKEVREKLNTSPSPSERQ